MADEEVPWIAVDVETTGLHTDALVLEVGMALLIPGTLQIADWFTAVISADEEKEWSGMALTCQPAYSDPAAIERYKSMYSGNPEDANDWCIKQHTASGLAGEIYNGDGLSVADVEELLISWMKMADLQGKPVMLGSSVSFDRGVLKRAMPRLESMFHYRNVDVSSVKELARAWMPEVLASRPTPAEKHRVMPDLMDTVHELNHYRSAGFIGKD